MILVIQMWKITNQTNKLILDDFRFKLIEPLFQEIINYKKLNLNCGFKEYIKKSFNIMYPSSRKLNEYLNERKKEKLLFSELINKIINKNSLKEIEKNYKLFHYQNSEVDRENYNIKQESVGEGFKELFINFFYEKFFDYERIWILLDPIKYEKSKFNRKVFHKNFKRENNIEICPYCDIDSTLNISNNEIEHFLPKSKYPYISMNGNNLIPSCHACNTKSEGKGDEVLKPIYAPFNIQIGNKIEFDNDIIQRKIKLQSNNLKIQNYLKLMNLNNRYSSERIYNVVENKAESIYETIYEIEQYANKDMSEKEIVEYIEKKCTKFAKKEPLSFAVKNIFNKYDLYLKYKKIK